MSKVAIFVGQCLLNGQVSAKHYPYWQQLIGILQWEGVETHQIGVPEDIDFGCDKRFVYSLPEIEQKLSEYDLFICIDTWIHHMAVAKGITTPGIVLWSLSDPTIFGDPRFINLSKPEYLRKDQHMIWHNVKPIKEAFYTAKEVAEIALKILKKE